MAITFYLSNINSDLTGGADFSKRLATSTDISPNTISVAVAGSATEVSYGFTTAGVPGVGGLNTGTFSIDLNINTANSNITISIALARVNSAGTEQAVTAYSTGQSGGTTGVKNFTFTNPSLGTWASGDRLRVQYRFVNGSMSSQTIIIGVGTVNEDVVTPFYPEQTSLYWVGGTGVWDQFNAFNWALSSGGTGGASFPTQNTNIFFDANSDSGSAFSVTISTNAVCNNFTASGLDQTMTLSGTAAWSVYGNITFAPSNFSVTATGTVSLVATSGTKTINANGIGDVTFGIFLNAPNVTYQLLNNLSAGSTRLFLLNAGTIDLQSYTLTYGTFNASGTLARSIAFGTGKIRIGGFSTTPWNCANLTNFSYTGTPLVEFFYIGGSGTRTIAHGTTAGASESTAVSFSFVNNATDSVAINGGCCKDLTFSSFSGFGGPISNGTIYGNLTLSSTMSISATGGTTTFAGTNVTQTIDTAGKTLARNFVINASGSTVELINNNLTLDSGNSLTLTAGTFNANNRNVTVGLFSSSNTNTRTLTMGSGIWTLTGTGSATIATNVWDTSTTTNFTFNKNTANIVYSAAPVYGVGFSGGGLAYNKLTISGTSSGYGFAIRGNNTFSELASTSTTPWSLYLGNNASESTITVTTWSINGSSGNVVNLRTGYIDGSGAFVTSTSYASNLVKAGGGTVSVSYINIQASDASPSSTWFALTSNGNVDNGFNTGWIFSSAPTYQAGNFFLFF